MFKENFDLPPVEKAEDYEGKGGLETIRKMFNKTKIKAMLVASVMVNMAIAEMAEAKNNSSFELKEGQKTTKIEGDPDSFKEYKSDMEKEFEEYKSNMEKNMEKEFEESKLSMEKEFDRFTSDNTDEAFNELEERVENKKQEVGELQEELNGLLDRLKEEGNAEDRELSKTLRVLTNETDEERLGSTIEKVKSILESNSGTENVGKEEEKEEKTEKAEINIDASEMIQEIEELQKKTADNLRELHENAKDNGRICITGAGIYHKEITSSGGEIQKIGYGSDEDMKTPKCSSSEAKDASILLNDNSFDGTVNKVVINNTEGHPSFKSTSNILKLAGDVEDIKEKVRIKARLTPEDVSVYQINYEDDEITIEKIDFQTGEYSKISGVEAAEQAKGFQEQYNKNIEKALEEVK